MIDFLKIETRAEQQMILLEGFFGFWPIVKEEVLWQLGQINSNDDLDVYIDSKGGDPDTAIAIRRAIQAHEGRTRLFVQGDLMSAATLLPGAFDEVVTDPFSVWLIHNPEIDPGWVDDVGAEAMASWIRIKKEQMIAMYVKDSGQSEDEIADWMKSTKVFSGTEAVELGFADRTEEFEERLVQADPEDIRIAASAYKISEKKLKGRSSSDTTTTTTKSQPIMDWMKKIKAAIGLGDDKDEADTVLSVKELKAKADQVDTLTEENQNLQQKNDDLKQKLQELQGEKETTEEEQEAAELQEKEAAIQAAVDSFRIKASDKDGWLEDYADMEPAKLKAALDRIPENAVKPGGSGSPSEPNKPRTRAFASANLNEQAAKELGVK